VDFSVTLVHYINQLREIKAEIEEGQQQVSWSGLLQCKKAVLIGCGLMFFQVRDY
jgi:hypothetical protein